MTNTVNNGSRLGSGTPTVPNGKAMRTEKTGTSDVTATSTAGAGTIDISTESSRLQQVRERIDATPDIDLARVEEIKLALAEGRLPLDPQRIAEKFAKLEGLLGS